MREGMVGKAAIGKVALYGREYLVAIQPRENGLVMYTLRHASEVRAMSAIDELKTVPAKIKPDEVKLARQVIGSFETEGDLTQYRDEYQDELRRIIDAKVAGEEIVDAGRRGAAEGRQPHGRAAAEPRARVDDQETRRENRRRQVGARRWRRSPRRNAPEGDSASPPELASWAGGYNEKTGWRDPPGHSDRQKFRSFISPPAGGKGVYAPRLYGAALNSVRATGGERSTKPGVSPFSLPLEAATRTVDWDAARPTDVMPEQLLKDAAEGRPSYLPLPAGAMEIKTFTRWAKNFDRWLARTQRFVVVPKSEGAEELSPSGPSAVACRCSSLAIVWELGWTRRRPARLSRPRTFSWGS